MRMMRGVSRSEEDGGKEEEIELKDDNESNESSDTIDNKNLLHFAFLWSVEWYVLHIFPPKYLLRY